MRFFPAFDAEIDGKALLLSGKETFMLQAEIELVTEQPLPRDLRGDGMLSELNLPACLNMLYLSV
ncbi:hypothetical protein AFL22_06430 [Pantoea sp. CFSAN033090]|nr:hypothetical protein AFL22_06430 [Pantoea sp. CFSAN033090]